MSIDDLRGLAWRRGGVFSGADARSCGFSRSALRHRVALGEWVRLRRGLFAEAAFCVARQAYDRTPALTLVAAAVAAVGPGAVVSHHSAALVLDLSTYGRVPDWVSVTSPRRPATTCESLSWLRVRRSTIAEDEVWEVAGLPVTSPVRTAVDVARGTSLRGAVVILDAALRAGCRPAELESVLRRQSRWPGVRAARGAAAVADLGSESPLESLAHVCQYEAGLPRPQTQVELYDEQGLIGRVDDYWPDHGVVGESDGLLKYSDAGVLRLEKVRQERLEQLGLRVVRVIHNDVTVDAARTRARYRAAFPGHVFAERMVARRGSRSSGSDHWLGNVGKGGGVEGGGWGA